MESHEVVWEFVKCEGGPVLPAVLVVRMGPGCATFFTLPR